MSETAINESAVTFLKDNYAGFAPWEGEYEQKRYSHKSDEELVRGVLIGRPGYKSLDSGSDPLSSFSSCLLELKGRIMMGAVDEASIQTVINHILDKIPPRDVSSRVIESITDFFVSVNAGKRESEVRDFLQINVGPTSQKFDRARVSAAVALLVRGDNSSLEVLKQCSDITIPIGDGMFPDRRPFPNDAVYLARVIAGDRSPEIEARFNRILNEDTRDANPSAIVGLLLLGKGEAEPIVSTDNPRCYKTVKQMALESHRIPEEMKTAIRDKQARNAKGGGSLNSERPDRANFMKAARTIEGAMEGRLGLGVHLHNRNAGRTSPF